MRRIPQPLPDLLLAAGFLVLALAGIVTGTVAEVHHMSGLSHLAAAVAGLAFGLAIGMTGRAYIIGVRVPSLARQLTAMVQAMDADQLVSGRFWAGLRDLVPGPLGREKGNRPGSNDPFPLPGQRPRLTRWISGQVVITPESVIWVRGMAGRARDLTGAVCTGERRLDPGYTEMTLTVPRSYKGEILKVITLHTNGTDVELVTQVRFLEVLRFSLAQTPSMHGSGTSRLAGSGETS